MTSPAQSALQELLDRPYAVKIDYIKEPDGKGHFLASMPDFEALTAASDTRTGALQKLLYVVCPAAFQHGLNHGFAFPEPGSAKASPPAKPVTPPPAPRAPWPTRMLVEEIATRIRSAMEVKGLSLFDLAEKLNWTPARLLQWLDGSIASPDLDDEEAGALRDLTQISDALDMRWQWRLGKAKKL